MLVLALGLGCRSEQDHAVQRTIPIVPSDAGRPKIAVDLEGMAQFARGYDASCHVGEECTMPIHFARAFAIDRYEVTVEEYRRCVDAGQCEAPTACEPRERTWPDKARHPMNCVDKHRANAYCQWKGKRLPVLEEWIRAAARNGTYYYNGRAPVCGSAGSGSAGDCTKLGPSEVGADPEDVSSSGVYDVYGNVSEYVVYLIYGDSEFDRIRRQLPGVYPMGGSFMHGDRSATPMTDEEPKHPRTVGFRCAVSLSNP